MHLQPLLTHVNYPDGVSAACRDTAHADIPSANLPRVQSCYNLFLVLGSRSVTRAA